MQQPQPPILLTDSIILANITKSDILKYHTQNPNCVLILNDGRIASSGCDYIINIHNIQTLTLDFQIKEKTNSILYIHQLRNDLLVSCSEDGYLHFYSISNQNYNLVSCVKSHDKAIYKVIELQNGNLCTCSLDKTIITYDSNLKPNYIIVNEFKDMIHDICEVKQNEICGVSSYDNFMLFYDFNLNIIKARFKNINITPWNNSLKMIDDKFLCVFGKNEITVFNVFKYNIVNKINTLKSDFLSCFILIQDRLITGDWNGNLKEWKIEGSNIVEKTIMERAHTTGIVSMDLLQDGRIVTASQDKTLKIWS